LQLQQVHYPHLQNLHRMLCGACCTLHAVLYVASCIACCTLHAVFYVARCMRTTGRPSATWLAPPTTIYQRLCRRWPPWLQVRPQWTTARKSCAT
jgi:hypothetical protein